MDFDVAVKTTVYRQAAASGRLPTVSTVAEQLDAPYGAVDSAFDRLTGQRVLVRLGREALRMAPPFSGVETEHQVAVGGTGYFANCAWDALGIAAALGWPATVRSTCGQSGEPIHLEVGADGPGPEPCVVHFAVPAAHWWDDIVHT